jgi:hypothetical protein
MEEERTPVLKSFGKYVRSVRRAKGVNVADLAGMAGFRDVTKGTEKINLPEQYGLVAPTLADNLITLLDPDPVESHILIEGDKENAETPSKDYWPTHRIHRDGTVFHAIHAGRVRGRDTPG